MLLTHQGSCDEKLPAEEARVDAPQPERQEGPAAALLGLLPSAVRETHPRGPRAASARKKLFQGVSLGGLGGGLRKRGVLSILGCQKLGQPSDQVSQQILSPEG